MGCNGQREGENRGGSATVRAGASHRGAGIARDDAAPRVGGEFGRVAHGVRGRAARDGATARQTRSGTGRIEGDAGGCDAALDGVSADRSGNGERAHAIQNRAGIGDERAAPAASDLCCDDRGAESGGRSQGEGRIDVVGNGRAAHGGIGGEGEHDRAAEARDRGAAIVAADAEPGGGDGGGELPRRAAEALAGPAGVAREGEGSDARADGAGGDAREDGDASEGKDGAREGRGGERESGRSWKE